MTVHSIRQHLDVYAPRRALEQLGKELGFRRNDWQELAIVVSELCSNIIKYGIRGSIEIEPVRDAGHGIGIAIVASDVGPPFRDFGVALQDGCDDGGPINPATLLRRGGLGIGLGAVVRLSDSLEIRQTPEGKAIRVVRYLVRPRTVRKSGIYF